MKKYYETSKILFKAQLVYRFDILTGMVFTISKIILAYVLWGAIFGKQNIISGFTFNSMLSYYILNSFITQLDQSSGTGWQIADEIRNGRFSKYIIKPIGIFRYFAAQSAGVSAFFLTFNLVAAGLWIFIFHVDFAMTSRSSTILFAAVLILSGLLFMLQLNFSIGILAFKFIDIGIFIMIKDNIVLFITGSLIPLALLPHEILRAMMYLPFYYISYLPSMLLLGRNENEAIGGIIVMLFWNITFGVVNSVFYKKLKSCYDGVGL